MPAVAFQYGGPGKVPAWKLEALTRPTTSDRIRPEPGAAGGATRGASRACDSRQPTTAHGQLHVCEVEVTALALAVQCQGQGKGFAIAAGGTSGSQVAACRDPD